MIRNNSEKLNTAATNKSKKAAIALSGALAVGALSGCMDMGDEIVSGAPAQVEAHLTGQHCSVFVRNICTSYVTDYYLDLEQCPEDIKNAKQGIETLSFDPEVGEVSSACNFGRVSVSAATYNSYYDGGVIYFDGEVGEVIN